MRRVRVMHSKTFGGESGSVNVNVQGVWIPNKFTTFFFFDDEVETDKEWSIELVIEIGEGGTPFIKELTARAQSLKDLSSGHISKPTKEAVSAIQARHISIMSKHLKNLLWIAIATADTHNSLKDFSEEDLRNYRREIVNRASKRRLTPEFLDEVLSKKTEIQSDLKRRNEKDNSNALLAELFGVAVKTIEEWLVKSKRSKEISAQKAESEKATTKKGKVK